MAKHDRTHACLIYIANYVHYLHNVKRKHENHILE